MIRLGLCCKFLHEPIRFRVRTAAQLAGCRADAVRRDLATLCRANALALQSALQYCATHGIGCFRVNSQILPLATHPRYAYRLRDLPGGREIEGLFRECGIFARRAGLRVTFHPDQFILLSSASPTVTRNSIRELAYQAEVAEWVGADVLNIHGGGAYGDRQTALARFARRYRRLPSAIRQRLTLENDDRVYSPADLIPLCRELGIPFVYDVHHHRCLPDGLSVETCSRQAIRTWNREPVFHISSPRSRRTGTYAAPHADYVDIRDFPKCWYGLNITVEVEAKAKEKAVTRLARELAE